MIPRSALKGVARMLLAVVLCVQAALAFAACDSASHVVAFVIAHTENGAGNENCHDEGIDVNLCVAHCIGDDRSLDRPVVKVPPLPDAPVLVLAAANVPRHDTRVSRRAAPPRAAQPPPRILFRSLLI
ncbi:MAG: hypothetical protein WAO95_03215 [Burkholderiales bacterium]